MTRPSRFASVDALRGLTVAVKDLFAIKGRRIGAGNPAYLADARPEATTAPAVADLLNGGATLRGVARTDEFAYSIAGDNPHYGTPPNGAVPGALPGGSSSGPASAVATGVAMPFRTWRGANTVVSRRSSRSTTRLVRAS